MSKITRRWLSLDLQQQLTGMQDDIDNLYLGITGINQDISGITAAVADLEICCTGAQQSIAGLTGAIADLEMCCTGARNDIAGLTGAIDNLEDQSAGFTAAIADLDLCCTGANADIAGLTGAVSDLKEQIAGITGAVSDLEICCTGANADISGLSGSLQDLKDYTFNLTAADVEFVPITGIDADDVQEAVEDLKTYIDEAVTGISPGSGQTGQTGATGIQGMTGALGITGLKGDTGIQGMTGPVAMGEMFTDRVCGITGLSVTGPAGVFNYWPITGLENTVYTSDDSKIFSNLAVNFKNETSGTHTVTFRLNVAGSWSPEVPHFLGDNLPKTKNIAHISDPVAPGYHKVRAFWKVDDPNKQTRLLDSCLGSILLEGALGPTGIQGETGMRGVEGHTGPLGGPPGATGLQGPMGFTGLQGATGPHLPSFDFFRKIIPLEEWRGSNIDPDKYGDIPVLKFNSDTTEKIETVISVQHEWDEKNDMTLRVAALPDLPLSAGQQLTYKFEYKAFDIGDTIGNLSPYNTQTITKTVTGAADQYKAFVYNYTLQASDLQGHDYVFLRIQKVTGSPNVMLAGITSTEIDIPVIVGAGVTGVVGTTGLRGATGPRGLSAVYRLCYNFEPNTAIGFVGGGELGINNTNPSNASEIWFHSTIDQTGYNADYIDRFYQQLQSGDVLKIFDYDDSSKWNYYTINTVSKVIIGLNVIIKLTVTHRGIPPYETNNTDYNTGSGIVCISVEGIPGITGLQGATGLEGAVGHTGPLGGPPGATGLKGATGAQGFTGAQGKGETGLQGIQGETGLEGAIGETGAQGKGETGLIGATGLLGPTGIQGETGAQGLGETGLIGETGLLGPTGAEGAVGETGSQGTTGIQGLQGDQGETGAQGEQGETGLSGAQGATGVAGLQGIQGDTGDQGETGLEGAQGATGIQGSQGETGEQGELGETGLMGETGIAGVQGETGVDGATGIEGPAGDQGDTGLQGETGAQGLTGVGETGIQGIQGDTGTEGPVGATGPLGGPKGATGLPGPTGIRGETGPAGKGVTGLIGATGIGITGPAGGPKGHTGSQGATGLQGVTGLKGVTGLEGVTGIQGIQGETGVYGETGIQGETGIEGAQGATGIQGETGIQGDVGDQGGTGIQGEQGQTGIQGIQGETGAQGIQGIQGETGIRGHTGAEGETGSQGETGALGITGLIGPTGIRGHTGAEGETGSQGETGALGITGLQGATGIEGITGLSYYPAILRTFKSSAGSSPAADELQLNNTDPSAATLITVNKSSTLFDSDDFYNSVGIGGYIRLSDADNFDYYNYYKVLNKDNFTSSAYDYYYVQNESQAVGYQTSNTNYVAGTGQVYLTDVGMPGFRGLTGVKGPYGFTGVEGPTGPAGKGETGLLGLTGLIGPTGLRGLTGSEGFGLQGVTGLQGPTGDTGTQGHTGIGALSNDILYNSVSRYEAVTTDGEEVWVLSSSSVYKNLTWSRTGTTLTIQRSGHGHTVGDRVIIRNTNMEYQVALISVSNPNDFSIVTSNTGLTSGNAGAYSLGFAYSHTGSPKTGGMLSAPTGDHADVQLISIRIRTGARVGSTYNLTVPASAINGAGKNTSLEDCYIPDFTVRYDSDNLVAVGATIKTNIGSSYSTFQFGNLGTGSVSRFIKAVF